MKTAELPLVVSIHDVRPGLLTEVREMLRILKAEGVSQTSLLVIPNFHREEPIEEHPQFLEQVKQWQSLTHELVLHAWHHRETPPPGRQSAWQYLISRHYTSGEGEFYRLDEPTAYDYLARGKALFEKLALKAQGFTAPAWLYSLGAINAIRAHGFAYYTTLTTVQPLAAQQNLPPIRARAIVWSHRAAWRRFTSNLCLPWFAKPIITRRAPLRLALHPPDFRYPQIRDCALQILRAALHAGYRPTTYLELVNRTSLVPTESRASVSLSSRS